MVKVHLIRKVGYDGGSEPVSVLMKTTRNAY